MKLVSVIAAQERVLFTFANNVEFHFPMPLTPELTAYLNLANNSKAPNITIDLTNPKQPIAFM